MATIIIRIRVHRLRSNSAVQKRNATVLLRKSGRFSFAMYARCYDLSESEVKSFTGTDEKKTSMCRVENRLREARKNMNIDKSEIAQVLDVGDEHYRKLESQDLRGFP